MPQTTKTASSKKQPKSPLKKESLWRRQEIKISLKCWCDVQNWWVSLKRDSRCVFQNFRGFATSACLFNLQGSDVVCHMQDVTARGVYVNTRHQTLGNNGCVRARLLESKSVYGFDWYIYGKYMFSHKIFCKGFIETTVRMNARLMLLSILLILLGSRTTIYSIRLFWNKSEMTDWNKKRKMSTMSWLHHQGAQATVKSIYPWLDAPLPA